MLRIRCALPLLLAVLPACTDAAGSGDGDPVGRDGAAPSVEITRPALGGRTHAIVNLTGHAGDDAAVTRLTLQVDGGAEMPVTPSPDPSSPDARRVSFLAPLTLPGGEHTAVVHAYDAAGNRGSSAPVRFFVDAEAPLVALEVPETLTIAADTLRVRGTVTDEYNLGKVEIAFGTQRVFNFAAANQGKVARYALDTLVSLSVGANTISVTALDSVGNLTRRTVVATRTAATAPARFDAVVANTVHGCGLRSGAAYCWGMGLYGVLGNGRALSRDTPVPVAGGLAFSSLAAGNWWNCGVTPAGAVYCWGAGHFGALGVGDRGGAEHPTPQRVASEVRFASVAAGTSQYTTCALSVAGEAYCWGANWAGQAGVPASTGTCAAGSGAGTPCVAAPARVQGGLRFTSLSVGGVTACGVAVDGRAYCWGGSNGYGLLGTGDANATSDTPVPVAGGLLFSRVSVGTTHACGVTTGGDAYCWGMNRQGALGDGTTQDRLVPTRVASTVRFRSVGVPGDESRGPGTCAQGEDGAVYCWGAGRGVPAPLAGGLTFTSLSPNHRCGVTADRAAYCWTPATGPVPVPGDYP